MTNLKTTFWARSMRLGPAGHRLSGVRRMAAWAFLAVSLGAHCPLMAGTLYVSDATGHSVYEVSPTGQISVFATFTFNPYGLAFDSQGNLYVADGSGAGIIDKVTPSGQESVYANLGSVTLRGLASDAEGDLFASNVTNNTVEEITPGGGVSVFDSTGINYPRGLAVDSSGDVYVANAHCCMDNISNKWIEEVTPGGAASVFAQNFNDPYGLVFDSQGNLYEVDGSAIYKITPSGVKTLLFTNTIPGAGMQGITLDPNTRDFYLASGMQIIQFTPGGVESTFARGGVPGTFGDAFFIVEGVVPASPPPSSSTPEPGSLGLAALGCTAGWAWKRGPRWRAATRRGDHP